MNFCTAMASLKFLFYENIQQKCTHQRLLKRFEKFMKNLNILQNFSKIKCNTISNVVLRILKAFCMNKKCNCFYKLFKFEICLKIRILLKTIKNN